MGRLRDTGSLSILLGLLCVLAALLPASAGAKDKPPCVAANTEDLTPTTVAPAWYDPETTPLCKKPKGDEVPEDGVVIYTAFWFYYEPCFGCVRWRTTPLNADYSAKDCELNYRECGGKIIGDAYWFWDTCRGRGLSAYELARNIRYWADRARANGPDWRVYTATEIGGNPYACIFSVTHI